MNFYISFEIADDAVGVNLAGRQRMLSQRMVKSLLDLEYSSADETQKEKALKELSLTVSLFDQTLTAFDQGGTTQSADGSMVVLSRVQSVNGTKALEEAKVLWQPYRQQLNLLLMGSNANHLPGLAAVIVYAKANNLQLLKLMNQLTLDLEGVATSKATRLRMIQTVGISLAVINFFIIMFHFLAQLRDSDRKVEKARKETIEILDTVNEGLFLVDKDLHIASQHSKKLTNMFGHRQVANQSFDQLLADIITQKNLETAQRFIGLLFRADIKANLIGDLNPLREVEVNIDDGSGAFINRFYHFDFSRVYDGEQIQDVLVTVNDITERVQLARELELTRQQNEHQLEALSGILHANPLLLKQFVNNCFDGFDRINNLLREPVKSTLALRKKLRAIFIDVHNFKGEASALGLDGFEDLAHQFEAGISDLQENKKLSGDDFLPLVVQLEKLIRYTESIQVLSDKLSAFGEESGLGQPTASSSEWVQLYALTESVSGRAQKKVNLVTCGLSEVPMRDEVKQLVKDVLIQCIRNAVVHGIEMPEERLQQCKPEYGRIDIRLLRTADGTIELCIEDDGQGIDHRAIRARAIASGLWAEDNLESWDSKRIASLIFEPGFSTAEQASLDAGRGVGMDLVKEKVRECRGKIRVSSRHGVSTQFLISIPPVIGEEMVA